MLPEQDGIDLYEPWLSYPLPESKCCDVIDPAEVFDAQGMLFNSCFVIVITVSH